MILTVPNVLTLLRLLLVPCFMVASFREHFMLAFVLFVTAAVTDIFDGMIARRFNQRSRIGALLDPAADKTMMICGYLFYTLHASVRMPIPAFLTVTVFVRDILIIMFAYLLYTRIQVKRFDPSWAGKLSTVLQAVALGAGIAMNAFLPPSLHWLPEILFRLSLVATLYSAFDYLRLGRRLLDNSLTGAAARP